jgi:hypothetical protein
VKIAKYARALQSLADSNLLSDPDCKEPVKEFIRKATETSSGHATTHYRSKEVAAAITKEIDAGRIKGKSAYQRYCSKNFKHEHMVPCETIYSLVLTCTNAAEIEKILRKYSIRATITVKQNELLDRGKDSLRARMPPGFSIPRDPLFQHPLARYMAVELHLELEKRPDDCRYWI